MSSASLIDAEVRSGARHSSTTPDELDRKRIIPAGPLELGF